MVTDFLSDRDLVLLIFTCCITRNSDNRIRIHRFGNTLTLLGYVYIDKGGVCVSRLSSPYFSTDRHLFCLSKIYLIILSSIINELINGTHSETRFVKMLIV